MQKNIPLPRSNSGKRILTSVPPSADSEMPIPFGISETGKPLDGIDDSSLRLFCLGDGGDGELRDVIEAKADDGPSYGVVGDIRDPNDLSKTGWGIVFAPSVDEKIREALAPLLKHREEQVHNPALFRIFEADTGHLPGDTAEIWLKRRKVRMDAVRPSLGVPYYIMIVGPPDEIPYEFQYALDLYWAVGRIWFPTAVEFRQYADSVVQYETMAASQLRTSKQMAVFAPCHDLDPATQAFSHQVAETMVNGTENTPRAGEAQGFAVRPLIAVDATRANLQDIFAGKIVNGPPALLFSGGHGKSFAADDPQQAEGQGGLICQDWQGYGYALTREHYFEASDLPTKCNMHGMIHFLFACYGGGWPEVDTFSRLDGSPKILAKKSMMARLPQALLAQRDGGALAVLAHIDRAWAYSFRQGSVGQTQAFSDVIARMMWGDRAGQATDQFNMRWAVLSRELSEVLDKARLGLNINLKNLANLWVARDDARNYILFGDPAVRLRVDDMPKVR